MSDQFVCAHCEHTLPTTAQCLRGTDRCLLDCMCCRLCAKCNNVQAQCIYDCENCVDCCTCDLNADELEAQHAGIRAKDTRDVSEAEQTCSYHVVGASQSESSWKFFANKSGVTRYLRNVEPRHTLTKIDIRITRKLKWRGTFDYSARIDLEIGWVSALDWLCNDREPREWRAVDDPYAEVPF